MWDHVRGNDTDAHRPPAMGRAGWFDEVMRFYDHYLKGVDAGRRPTRTRRSRSRPATAPGAPRQPGRRPTRTPLHRRRCKPGSYTDDGNNKARGEARLGRTGDGIWTFSPPLAHDAALRGRAQVDARRHRARSPNANLSADVYDIDATTTRRSQPQRLPARRRAAHDRLRPLRQRLEDPRRPPHRRAGDRVQRRVVDARPTLQTVTVKSGCDLAAVPRCRRTRDPGRPVDRAGQLQGERAVRGRRRRPSRPPRRPRWPAAQAEVEGTRCYWAGPSRPAPAAPRTRCAASAGTCRPGAPGAST